MDIGISTYNVYGPHCSAAPSRLVATGSINGHMELATQTLRGCTGAAHYSGDADDYSPPPRPHTVPPTDSDTAGVYWSGTLQWRCGTSDADDYSPPPRPHTVPPTHPDDRARLNGCSYEVGGVSVHGAHNDVVSDSTPTPASNFGTQHRGLHHAEVHTNHTITNASLAPARQDLPPRRR